LLHQSIAQIGIVIHDQDLAGIGHGYHPLGAAARASADRADSWSVGFLVGKV
jgi:hypothetical protein